MKEKYIKYFSILAVSCIILAGGCATTDSTEKLNARKALTEASVPFSSGAFLKAAGEGRKDIVELFLKAGMDINTKDNGNVLAAAVRKGQKDMVAYLIEKGADVDTGNYLGSPLCFTCKEGNLEIARMLIDNDAEIEYDSPFGTPLIIATANGHSEIVKLLLENDADIDCRTFPANETPLMIAATNGNTEIARILIEKHASIDLTNVTGDDALTLAVIDNHSEIVNLLIENGAKIKGETAIRALTEAAGRNESEILTQLIEMGMDANLKVPGEMPLVVWAVKNGYFDSAKILIKNGADISVPDKDGETALDYAITSGNKEMIDLLKTSKKEPAAASPSPSTP